LDAASGGGADGPVTLQHLRVHSLRAGGRARSRADCLHELFRRVRSGRPQHTHRDVPI